MQLVARLAALYGAAIDPENPDDLLAIMNFAFGGAAAQAVSREGARLSKAVVGRYYAKKESFEVLKRFAKKLGYKLLRRSIVNGIVPGVSMAMGALWNKRTTKTIGLNAVKYFSSRPPCSPTLHRRPDSIRRSVVQCPQTQWPVRPQDTRTPDRKLQGAQIR